MSETVPPIVAVFGDATALDHQRCRALAELRRRVAEVSAAGEAGAAPPEPAAALLALARQGLLSYRGEEAPEVLYTPSRAAHLSLLAPAAEEVFPAAVHKRQTKALRTSDGALFRFQAEDGQGQVEVFITDWSPCPAAAAVAVHRDHPFVAGLDKPPGESFTGRFVRHPLTGDLLPLWIAGWVKPHFGTGAVLVNPAHDATDLEFGRRVGLPLRFGLVPPGTDGTPATWPSPPVIKSGTAIRSGLCDGAPAMEAMARYFEVLAGHGLAERYQDVQAGQWCLARLLPAAGGELRWQHRRRALLAPAAAAADADAVAVSVEAGELLPAALGLAGGSAPVLLCPAAEQSGALLALRLLCFDLHGRPLAPAEVVAVQTVQESKTSGDDEVVTLALLVGAPPAQVAVLKQQALEQTQRFLRVHAELLERAAGGGVAAEEAPKAAVKVKQELIAGDPARAFGSLYALQKQLAAAPTAVPAAYFALAWVLAGLAAPQRLSPRQLWQHL